MSIISLADLRKFAFFRCFTEKELVELLSHVERITLEPEMFLFRENEAGRSLFLIEKGEVEVLKRQGTSGRMHALSTLGAGDVIGEMAWIEKVSRFASAKAAVKTQLLKIPTAVLLMLESKTQLKIHRYLNQQLSQRLRETGKQAVQLQREALQLRSAMGNFIVYLMILLFLYFYSMIMIHQLKLEAVSSTLISFPILTVFALMMVHMMRRSGYPLRFYGLTWKKGRKAAFEALGITGVVLLVLVGVKWLLFQGAPVFQPLGTLDVVLLILGYCLFMPVQELIYRGALQSSLQHFLMGRHRTLVAILVSNLPFSMIYLHISLSWALCVYLVGVLWGWMYARQGTLVGVILSHLIIGVFAFFFLGIQSVLRA